MLRITKTGNLYQVRNEEIGCVFQSYDKEECKRYIRTTQFLTANMDCRYISPNAKAHTIIRL